MASNQHYRELEEALFSQKIQGVVATFSIDERPLHGLAGLLDWRFHGAITHFLRTGAVTGETNEVAYLPIARKDRTYHLILVGVGTRTKDRRRGEVPDELFKNLNKSIRSLGIQQIGVSREDLGGIDEQALQSRIEEVKLWVSP